MVTSPQSRIASLIKAQKLTKPVAPDLGEVTFAEKEFEEQIARQEAWKQPNSSLPTRSIPAANSSAKVDPKPAPMEWPDIAYGDNSGANEVQLSGSEDDEYSAAFAKTPKMKPPKAAKTKTSTTTKHEDFSTAAELRKELATVDKHGNPVVGHFCLLTLVSKFPYKYMSDGEDRVSKRFFAANKFYDRTWDL
jgi:hypothetical protein